MNLWVGMRTSGLNRVVRRRLTVIGQAEGRTNDFVRSVTKSADGRLWVMLKYQDGVITPITNRVARGTVSSLVQEPDGTLWVGSVAGGAFVVDVPMASTPLQGTKSDSRFPSPDAIESVQAHLPSIWYGGGRRD